MSLFELLIASFFMKIWSGNKLLLVLITFEFMNVFLLYYLIILTYLDFASYVMLIIFLLMSVTESVLGLCLFVGVTRATGADMLRSIKKTH